LQAARLRTFLSSLPDDPKAPVRQPFMHSRRRQKAITKQLSYKLLRPIAAYDSERYALF